MTREQDQAHEALCLRDGGFARAEEGAGGSVKIDTGHGRRYWVLHDGSWARLLGRPGPIEWRGLADLLAEVYGEEVGRA